MLCKFLAIGSLGYELALPTLIGVLVHAIYERLVFGDQILYHQVYWEWVYTAVSLSIFAALCEWARISILEYNGFWLSQCFRYDLYHNYMTKVAKLKNASFGT